MPPSNNALLRYATLDECLQRRARRWTFAELQAAVAERLDAQLGTRGKVSVRTLREDLKNMRPGGSTGYEAPIAFSAEQGYYYSEAGYSIFNMPVTIEDLAVLHQVLRTLRQLQGLGMADELRELVQRLELRLSYQERLQDRVAVQFEQAPQYQGQQWLKDLYAAIGAQQSVWVAYQPFGAEMATREVVSPYLLKQYNGRWFVVGQRHGRAASVFALDRIQGLEPADEPYQASPSDPATWFEKLIGVSLLPDAQEAVVQLRFTPGRLPYVLTKPMHASQQVRETEHGPVVELRVVPTRELLTLLLSFGGAVEVLGPAELREMVQQELWRAVAHYGEEVT
ncbi:WYL domain-containing protein [Hymenobacter ginsengisoli]|uniref:WYL domain-containing protein n=1 Tax=Hymenobacter ginsengisoli TaxID=1051626 RepID=A0ABP8PUE6_9BACT|nr:MULTISPECIES: WYL domain-containing protein [unclassified Hymenobacter]MBO2033561.1 WYL domain-containing protein [Hymenobacter sp. BT559]